MNLNYSELFSLDLITLLFCLGLMLRYGGLTALHPAALYFFFHAYTYTFRLWQLANGAPTLFSMWTPRFLSVTRSEIQRASLVALVALLVMTIVWLYWARKAEARATEASTDHLQRPFSKRIMWMVTAITLPVGILAIVILRGPVLSGGTAPSLGSWSTSSYLISMYQWFGISLLALIFYYGFRWNLLLPLLAYLLLGLLTFPGRTMVIVPALFVLFTYLRRANLHWPPLRLTLALVLLALLFVAGKSFGPLLRQGDFASARAMLTQRLVDMQSGTHGDAMFMDMLAVTLSQVDEHGRFYYGGTYASVLVVPIPRALWPNKPGLADWQKELQSPSRPTGQMGMITTTYGEAYANLGYAGIILYAIGLATLLHWLHDWMLRLPYYSLANFWSLCVYAILIQVFRDGFIAFVIFQVGMFMPLTAITLLHMLFLRRRYRRGQIFAAWATIFDQEGYYIDPQGDTVRTVSLGKAGYGYY